MSMNRSLGEGSIVKLLKTYGFIRDDRLGQVYFPISAAAVTSPCADLRDKFTENEIVIFTAQRQHPPKNDCQYCASSVVKRSEMIDCQGKVTEVSDKYCYAEVPRVGRVFVPFSARNSQCKPWLGKGAVSGAILGLKIFPQPDIKTCKFVAFNISIRPATHSNGNDTNLLKMASSQGGAHRAPDIVLSQTGCIVVFRGAGGESLVYSSVTGLATLPAKLVESYMEAGSWIRYNAVKCKAPDTKVAWTVSSPVDLGMLYEVLPDPMDNQRLIIECYAVVNRVCDSTRVAWLWNDLVGRIYLPALFWRAGLRPLECVRIRALYTGNFDDVPWSATLVQPLDAETEDTEKRACSQMLHTCDGWKVAFVQHANATFYCFLDHGSFGSAFAAWTDFAEGEDVPSTGMPCRVTVYRQERDKKHVYRAVLVSPLDSMGDPIFHHPVLPHMQSNASTCLLPVQLPVPYRPPAIPVALPPCLSLSSMHASAPISPAAGFTSSFSAIAAQGLATSMDQPMAAIGPPAIQYDAMGLQQLPEDLHHNGNGAPSQEDQDALDRALAEMALERASVPLSAAENGELTLTAGSQSSIGSGHLDSGCASAAASKSGIFSDGHTLSSSLAFNGFQDDWWQPVSNSGGAVPADESLAPGYKGTPTKAESKECKDAEAQTDQMSEQKVMRDIISNSALLVKIFEVFPQHVDSIMSISSLLPFPR